MRLCSNTDSPQGALHQGRPTLEANGLVEEKGLVTPLEDAE